MGRGWFLYNSLCVHTKGIVSRDFEGLQIILMNRTWVPGVPLDVWFLFFVFIYSNIISSKFDTVKLLLIHKQKLSVRPGTVLFPGAYYSPGIRFKTTAAILAVGQRILSYDTCWGIQLLGSGNLSWLLHLPGTAPTDRGSSVSLCYKPNLTFDTCRGLFESCTAIERGFQ